LSDIAFVSLLYSVLYLVFLTIAKETGNHFKGFVFIYPIPLIAIAFCLLRGNAILTVVPRNLRDASKIFLILFIVYMLVMALRYPTHEVSLSYLKQLFNKIVIGTILGYLVFGSYTLRNYRLGASSTWWRRVDMALCAAATAIVTLISIWVSQSMRSDYFLLRSEFVSGYQTFGDYLILSYICYISIIYRHLSYFFTRNFLSGLGWSVVLSIITLALVLLAQAVGSNEATIAILVLGAGFGIIHLGRCIRRNTRTGLWTAAASTAVTLLLAAGFIALLTVLPPLRILNFNQLDAADNAASSELTAPQSPLGSAPISAAPSYSTAPSSPSAVPSPAPAPPQPANSMISNSFISRIDIWGSLAAQQFAYSPIFGDLGVDQILGHTGYYVHSAASIQSHLGAIGSILFLGFILERLINLYRFGTDTLLKVIAPIILAGAAMVTFFTWLPLWFVVGALYAPWGKGARAMSATEVRDVHPSPGTGG
jgi:hypothetical protein